MKKILRQWLAAVLGCSVVLGLAAPVFAQRSKIPAGPAARDLGPAEIQRLFDAYTAMQAQEALELDDVQFGRFLPRLRAVQETRRRSDVERQRLTAELGRMLSPGQNSDDARLREQLKVIADVGAKAQLDLRAAYEALDQTLDTRRQARFKVFEQQMERRKFELVLRARRAEAGRLMRDDRQ